MIPMNKFSIVTLLSLSAALAAQGELTLRTNAKKGSSVWLLQEQKQEQTIDQGGQTFETTTTTTHTLHVSVLEVDDKGVMTVETEVVRIHGAMDLGPMGEVEFDSAAPPSEEDDDGGMGMPSPGAMAKQATKLAGKKFTAKVDNQGKVTSLDGVAELVKATRGTMGSGASEGSLKQMVEGAFGMMPEKPVAVGGTWEHTQKDTGRVSSNQKLTLTLAKADDASFEVTAVGTIEPPSLKDEGDDKDPMAAMMKNMKIENGKIRGSQKVSRADGFLVESAQQMSMNIEMDGPMGAFSIEVKQTTSTKRTTAEAAMPKKAEKTEKAEPAKDAPKEAGKGQ